MATLICAETLWSFSLACIESILADNRVILSQRKMIADFRFTFPRWETQPGFLGTAEYEKFFEVIGFPVVVYHPQNYAESIYLMAEHDTVGAILTTQRFWENSAKLRIVDSEHALRLVTADSAGLTLMNPCRCPNPGIIENYSWETVASFTPQVLVFKRR